MRLTTHNARIGKDGAFMVRHNDRDFDVVKAEHIDQEKELRECLLAFISKTKAQYVF